MHIEFKLLCCVNVADLDYLENGESNTEVVLDFIIYTGSGRSGELPPWQPKILLWQAWSHSKCLFIKFMIIVASLYKLHIFKMYVSNLSSFFFFLWIRINYKSTDSIFWFHQSKRMKFKIFIIFVVLAEYIFTRNNINSYT